MSDAEQTGYDIPEPCDNCGDLVETAIGMDRYVQFTHFKPTSMDRRYYCDAECLAEDLNDGSE